MSRIKSKRTPKEEFIVDLAHAFAKYGVYPSCDAITTCVKEHALPIAAIMMDLEFTYDSTPNTKYKHSYNVF